MRKTRNIQFLWKGTILSSKLVEGTKHRQYTIRIGKKDFSFFVPDWQRITFNEEWLNNEVCLTFRLATFGRLFLHDIATLTNQKIKDEIVIKGIVTGHEESDGFKKEIKVDEHTLYIPEGSITDEELDTLMDQKVSFVCTIGYLKVEKKFENGEMRTVYDPVLWIYSQE